VQNPLFNLTKAERAELTNALVDALHQEPDVVFAYLHGSFAAEGPFHDIDVGVYLIAPEPGRVLDLTDRLSRRTACPVDVRALNEAPVSFQFRALQGTLLVSRDDERLANFIERVGPLYLDMAPLVRRAAREAFAR
jgi:hypothetical protein